MRKENESQSNLLGEKVRITMGLSGREYRHALGIKISENVTYDGWRKLGEEGRVRALYTSPEGVICLVQLTDDWRRGVERIAEVKAEHVMLINSRGNKHRYA